MSHTWDNPGTGQVHNRGVFDAPPTTQPEDLATGSRSTPSQPGDSTGVLQRYGPLVARILICQVFLLSGVMKIVDWSGTEAEMAGRGMFWIPFFLAAATAVELGGGLSLLLGFWGRLGALVLFLYLIPVTLTFHTWWTYPPEQQMCRCCSSCTT